MTSEQVAARSDKRQPLSHTRVGKVVGSCMIIAGVLIVLTWGHSVADTDSTKFLDNTAGRRLFAPGAVKKFNATGLKKELREMDGAPEGNGLDHSNRLCTEFNGIDHPNYKGCCAKSCGKFCGSEDCHLAPEGGDNCCEGGFKQFCGIGIPAPCLLNPDIVAKSFDAMKCSKYNGIDHPNEKSCCHEDCGVYCGAAQCDKGPGGSAKCCAGQFLETCGPNTGAPCVLPVTTTPTTTVTTAPKPHNLQYKVPSVFNPGSMVNLKPKIDHGGNSKFSVHPELPDGLQLDAKTGVIQGKLGKGEQKETDYTVTAEAPGGSASTMIAFSIKNPVLTFEGVPDSIERGKKYTLRPRIQFFTPKSFTANHALPEGFKLNPTTGEITGETSCANDQEIDIHIAIAASEAGAAASVQTRIHFKVAKKKDAFPWIMVIAGAVAVAAMICWFCKPKKDKREPESYKPVAPASPKSEPLVPLPLPGPFTLKMTWETQQGQILVTTATKKPLGLKFPSELPIKIHKELHAHGEELGIEVGWKLLELEEMDGEQSLAKYNLQEYESFKAANDQLHRSVCKLPQKDAVVTLPPAAA